MVLSSGSVGDSVSALLALVSAASLTHHGHVTLCLPDGVWIINVAAAHPA